MTLCLPVAAASNMRAMDQYCPDGCRRESCCCHALVNAVKFAIESMLDWRWTGAISELRFLIRHVCRHAALQNAIENHKDNPTRCKVLLLYWDRFTGYVPTMIATCYGTPR